MRTRQLMASVTTRMSGLLGSSKQDFQKYRQLALLDSWGHLDSWGGFMGFMGPSILFSPSIFTPQEIHRKEKARPIRKFCYRASHETAHREPSNHDSDNEDPTVDFDRLRSTKNICGMTIADDLRHDRQR